METTQKNKIIKLLSSMLGILIFLLSLTFMARSFLSGLILFIVALLIFPKTYNFINTKINFRISRVLKLVIICILFIVSLVLLAGNSKDVTIKNVNISNESRETKSIFNLDVLYGKNVDEIKNILGKPEKDTEPKDLQVNATPEQLAKEWDKTWKKDGWELLVTYDVSTRKVKDFFIPTNDPSGFTKNVDIIKKIMGIEKSDLYTLEPVKAIKDPSLYTGLIATPKK
jgi:hypothetical protein